tara:strand:+ start:291 stop:932 length:642 start_codon:yes stop_codon:yes gene_type:complete
MPGSYLYKVTLSDMSQNNDKKESLHESEKNAEMPLGSVGGCCGLSFQRCPDGRQLRDGHCHNWGPGGTCYPVGVAISTLIKVKFEPSTNISVSAISSAGSGENLKLMDEDQIQFGILQRHYGAYAWNGSGPVPKAYKNLRSVSMLWQNVEHFVVTRKVTKTGTIEDMTNLYGESFSIGGQKLGHRRLRPLYSWQGWHRPEKGKPCISGLWSKC